MIDVASQSEQVVPSSSPMISVDAVRDDTQRIWPAIMTAMLGVVVVLFVGFAPGIVHQVAHDTRHAMVFPCH